MEVINSIQHRRGAFPRTMPKPKPPKRKVAIRSLASGDMSAKPMKPQVKSLGVGSSGVGSSSRSVTLNMSNASISTSKEHSYSVGSTASADSFVLLLDGFQNHALEEEEESTFDPYLGRRRRKKGPQQQYVKLQEDHVTTCTSSETDSPQPSRKSPLDLPPAIPTTLRAPALVKPRQPPSIQSEESSEVTRLKLRTAKQSQEQSYWNAIVTSRTMTYGMVHKETAEAFLSCGHAHLRSSDHREALKAFKSACRIFRLMEGPNHLSVARSLDAVGLAALRGPKTPQTLKQAKRALDEAFCIRFSQLGPWHVDTVETYNKIASVHLHLGDYTEAASCYSEVYLVRKAIFGQAHPSVAIAAHSLANVYLKLSETKDSLYYFNIALDIYTQMGLAIDHPTVAKLLKDRKRLERVQMPMQQRIRV